MTHRLSGDGNPETPIDTEDKQPEMALRFSIPKGVSMDEAKIFAQGLLDQIGAWHKACEADEPSVDVTKVQP